MDQRVYKAEIKKQKRGKEMTPTPTFGKWFPGLREREKRMVGPTSEEDQTSRPEGSQGS